MERQGGPGAEGSPAKLGPSGSIGDGRDAPEIVAAVRALKLGAGSEAFEPIYRTYFRSLRRFFAHLPVLSDDAEDLAQATLVLAYQKIHQYRGDASFGTWLRKIGENLWSNTVKRRKALKRRPEVMSEDTEGGRESEGLAGGEPIFAPTNPDPERQAQAAERKRIVRTALESLPPGMRRFTELRLMHDFKYQEIADLTGVGLNTVRSQLWEARQRLRPILEPYFPGGVDF